MLGIMLLIFLSACMGHKTDGDLPLIKETDHARFYSPDVNADKEKAVTKLAEAFEAHYIRIVKLFQLDSTDKTIVHVYTNKADFQKMIGRNTEGTYVASENIIKVYTPESLNTPGVEDAFTDQIVHEFVHAVIQQINPDIGKTKWLDEGIAYYTSNQLQKELQARSLFLDIPTLEQLASPDYFNLEGGEAYFYSGLIIQYIVDKYGEDTLNEIIRNPEQNQFERIMQTTIDKFYEEWKGDLQKNQ
ncbi:hypothetical protein [Paenibacillus sp. NEAU-GSW1]|uniref:hypothetical protein n=1 Tax=Paenibacillus sp. NEAU-GSW1 TaxID=2682486 RepID=UPI001C12BD18|nr:hypothetical protein [Paenibacillus sp. NEAU-GSW1]